MVPGRFGTLRRVMNLSIRDFARGVLGDIHLETIFIGDNLSPA